MGSERGRRSAVAVAAVAAAALAFLTVIQIRSQAEVARSLEGQDNTSLAFLIDQLHDSNDQLAAQAGVLAARREALSQPQTSALAELSGERDQLRVVAGLVPVAGPGIRLRVDAPLTAIDLQDAANSLRNAGAEAISIDGLRVVAGTPITQSHGQVYLDGSSITGPWSIAAIGNPATLEVEGQALASSLRADPRVRSVVYATAAVRIDGVVRQRPFVYAAS